MVGGIGGLKVYLGWGAGEGARAPSPLWVGLGGLGLPGTFGSEQSHVQVSVLLDPLFVDLEGEGSGQAQARGLVGEDAHQQGPAFEFLIEPDIERGDVVDAIGAGVSRDCGWRYESDRPVSAGSRLAVTAESGAYTHVVYVGVV